MSESDCSFCARSRMEVAELIQGPNVTICNHCVTTGDKLAGETGRDQLLTFAEPCSFCRQTESYLQFRGRLARICDLCIGMCVEIIAEERAAEVLPRARVIKHGPN